jgi:hypothetical protein
MSVIYWDNPRLRPTIMPMPKLGTFWGWVKSLVHDESEPWERDRGPQSFKPKPRFNPPPEPDEPLETLARQVAEVAKTVRPDHHEAAKASLRAMNYGEFKAYCEGTGSDPDKVWTWVDGTPGSA